MARTSSLRRLLIAAVAAITVGVPALAVSPAAADAAGAAPPAAAAWTAAAAPGCGATAQVLVPGPRAGLADPALSPARRSLLAQIKKSGVRMQTSASCTDGRRGHPAPPRTRTRTRTAKSATAISPDDASNTSYTNWSGFENYDNVSYTEATMAWTVPTAKGGPSQELYSSIWPGIGSGDSASSALIQDGTDQDAFCNTSYCTGVYDFWYEVYPAEASKTVSGLSVHAGDKVQTSVIYDPSDHSVLFFFANATTQKGLSITQSVSGLGDRVDQSQVEWIVERPSIGGDMTALTDFGTLTLSKVQYVDSSYDGWVPGGYSGSQLQITMQNCAGTQNLAVPYGWTSDLLTFYDVWVNSGKRESC